jgi:hypothetical protein
MPTEEGRNIPGEVLAALLSQDVDIRLWVSTRVGDRKLADARNNVKQYGASELVLMLDNDVAMPAGSLVEMRRFLDGHADFGAIGLCKHRRIEFANDEAWLAERHIDMSCVLFRRDVLERVTFLDRHNATTLGRKSRGCECINCCNDIRAMGLRIGFLPNVYADHLHSEAQG